MESVQSSAAVPKDPGDRGGPRHVVRRAVEDEAGGVRRTYRRLVVGLAVGAASALFGMGLAPAGAKERLDSFSGSCLFQGTVTFSPPATNSQQLLNVVYDATGTCTGTLNGGVVSSVPVRVHAEVQSDGSCLHASTIAPGQGAITFADGTTIRYTFEFDWVLSEGIQTFEGERSGSGSGHGTFLTQRSDPDIAAKCGGEGLAEAPMDLSLTTESPLVSKHRGGRH
jgi:hypothetical protein